MVHISDTYKCLLQDITGKTISAFIIALNAHAIRGHLFDLSSCMVNGTRRKVEDQGGTQLSPSVTKLWTAAQTVNPAIAVPYRHA